MGLFVGALIALEVVFVGGAFLLHLPL
jgi:hypothetical protein